MHIQFITILFYSTFYVILQYRKTIIILTFLNICSFKFSFIFFKITIFSVIVALSLQCPPLYSFHWLIYFVLLSPSYLNYVKRGVFAENSYANLFPNIMPDNMRSKEMFLDGILLTFVIDQLCSKCCKFSPNTPLYFALFFTLL